MGTSRRPLYLIEQRRTFEVEGGSPENALKLAVQAFNAYQIADHPQVKAEVPKIVEYAFRNLPMYLNLSDTRDMNTVIGRAEGIRDPMTGQAKIEIYLGPSESELFDQMTEIAELKAVGFAGYLKRGAFPRAE